MIKTQTSSLPYALDPVPLYRGLCSQFGRRNTMLLESADIHTRAGQKSFLMIKAALKFRAYKERVVVESLSSLGNFLLDQLTNNPSLPVESRSESKLVFAIHGDRYDQSLSAQLHKKSCLDVLRDAIKLHVRLAKDVDPSLFLVAGILAYDLVDHFEKLPNSVSDPHEFPDYAFWFPEVFVVVDHISKKSRVVTHSLESQTHNETPSIARVVKQFGRTFDQKRSRDVQPKHGEIPFSSDISDTEFASLVEKLKERIVAGDVFQIVPSRTFNIPCKDSLLSYERLKAINPSPYMYYVVDDEFELCGASPETFIKLDAATRKIEVKPIAGTRRRGFRKDGTIDPELDSRLEAELRLDTKELAEHMMLVDLARNDIARVSELGTRQVHRLLSVERYSHVMHLVSHVQGKLRNDLDGMHAYQASMNMGTLVGAPKIKAAQILRENELTKRGTYGGAIGYLDAAGNFDTAIIIRSALIRNNVAFVRAGAGVVYDSVPIEETKETLSKASSVLSAIHSANLLIEDLPS